MSEPWMDRGHLRDDTVYCSNPLCRDCDRAIAMRERFGFEFPRPPHSRWWGAQVPGFHRELDEVRFVIAWEGDPPENERSHE